MIITPEVKKAALDAICALFNNGSLQLTSEANGSGIEQASLTFGATAFLPASVASPSIATSQTLASDTSITVGTILGFNLRNAASAIRIAGNVGITGADLNVANNVIPDGTTSISCPNGLTLVLQIV